MKKDRWFNIIVSVLAIAMLAAAAVLSYGLVREERIRITVIVEDSGNARWKAFRNGLRKAAEDEDVDLRIVNTDRVLSTPEQQSLVERELQEGADALLLQPYSEDGISGIRKALGNRPLILLGSDAGEKEAEGSTCAVVSMDNTAAGRAIGEELAGKPSPEDASSFKTFRIGILSEHTQQKGMQERLEGIREAAEAAGGSILWTISLESGAENPAELLDSNEEVDAVVALDNRSLETAADVFAVHPEKRPQLYGFGISSKVIYYLDTGLIEAVLVPDEFSMGYLGVTEAAKYFKKGHRAMEDHTIGYMVIHRDEIFNEEYQKMLFPGDN